MSRAEELLDSLTEEQIMMYGVNPADEPHIVIESDKTITVPDDLRHIAVQGEHNIETVTFDCPRYWDGHDLSQMIMRIVYQRPDGHREPHLVENLRVDEVDENTIHFDWTVSGNVTAVKGNISFTVCAKISDSEGNREREWHTRLNQDLVVDEGMDCSGEEIVEQNPDILEAILVQLDDLKNTGGVSDEQIANAVAAYLTENPIESGVDEQQVRDIVAAYLEENPPEGGTVTEEQIETAVANYMAQHPIEAESGGHYTPVVTQPTDDTMQVSFTPSKADMPTVPPVTVNLPVGEGSGQNLDLGFVDGRLYILVSGIPVGKGVEIGGAVVPPESCEGAVVFAADFSGGSPDPAQFYTWEGREYNGATWDALENIRCVDGVAVLTNKYDADKGLWVEQLMTTGGLFESDDFTCKFRAKFSGLPGAWNYFITYGAGTHWTSGMYSDGIKWPAGGEIDAFEQAPIYSENPTAIMHGAHWGSGSNSGYPDTHEWVPDGVAGSTDITTDEWHDFEFRLKNGVATMWIDGEQVHAFDLSGETVSNNYLVDYHPFLRPHALYMAAQCHSGDSRTDKDNVYVMEISDLEVYQDALVECAGLEIYPQMWARGTELVFPVGAELYLDREYTPSNTSNKACRWESSNNSVATVVQGYVKVVGTGTAVITATCGNATAQYTVTAAEAANVPCVKLVTKGEIGVTVGDTVDVADQLYLYPKFTTDEITLTTDSELVSINGSSVTMLGSGSAEITVTVGNCSAALMLNIASGAPELMMEYDYVMDGAVKGNPQSYIQWAAGGTYTLHYQIAENPKYTGTVEFPTACRMMDKSGSNKAPDLVFNTGGGCEIRVGDAYPQHTYTPSMGDWVTIVFTAAGGKTAKIYVNGNLVADDFLVYEGYLYIGTDLRPVELFERTTVPQYCVGRIEIYRGDNHELHKAG